MFDLGCHVVDFNAKLPGMLTLGFQGNVWYHDALQPVAMFHGYAIDHRNS